MSEQPNLDIVDIMRHFREINAAQAQEIAILKATVDALSKQEEKAE